MKTTRTRSSPQPAESDPTPTLSRRKFLKGGLVAAAAASAASVGLPPAGLAQPGGPAQPGGDVAAEQTLARGGLRGSRPANRPNILIILCDEMRFPPSYESPDTKQFRQDHLQFQDKLRENGLDFQRHYIMSAACVPSRASILTGHYPSLHGATQTPAVAKEAWDGDVFWVDPNTVPTFGNYFRAAGYRTYWRGKWHVSHEDIIVPGTHTSLVSFDPDTGEPDDEKEALYTAADRLDPYGFSGWIGPEPHGSDPIKDSGSSVPPAKQGRDVGYAQQAVELIKELDQDTVNTAPWLVVTSFVNPHDIGMFGFWSTLDPRIVFPIDPDVPPGDKLFTTEFDRSLNDDLTTKPSCQKSYRDNYFQWLQPILYPDRYYQYYYQLHKNVDEQMLKVLECLLNSRFRDDTIVVFTSDHGDLLGAHGYMHQKMYQAYEETIRVPLMIWCPMLFTGPRSVDALTSHADLAPTLLQLAGIDAEAMRLGLAASYSDAIPMVGRDLSPLILGQVDADSVNDPVYFMTDDEPFRGLHDSNADGTTKPAIVQPNHIETVVARLDDGHLWKYSRYFDDPQYWSSPEPEVDKGVEDVSVAQLTATPEKEYDGPIRARITVKLAAKPDEFEMYDLDNDPTELKNLYGEAGYSSQQTTLAQLLDGQRAAKRITPCSGTVPGQVCNRKGCDQACG